MQISHFRLIFYPLPHSTVYSQKICSLYLTIIGLIYIMDDFDHLLQAIQQNDEAEINKYSSRIIPRVSKYLQTVCNAPEPIAEEVAMDTFRMMFEKIINNQINIDGDILNYFLVSSRHAYNRAKNRRKKFVPVEEVDLDEIVGNTDQIDALVDEERMNILRYCLKKLDEGSRKLISFILEFPSMHLKEIASRFKMTYGSIRVKKSQIITKLHKCYVSVSQKKADQ